MSETTLTPARLRRGYGPIYRKLSRCGTYISNPAKLVLLNLMERLGQNANAWPSQDTIGQDVDLARQTVNECLKELAGIGFISWKRRGLGQTNIYSLNLDALISWGETMSVMRTRQLTQKDLRKSAQVTESIYPIEGIPKEAATPPHPLSPPSKIFGLYEDLCGSLTPYMATVLQEAEDEYPAAWIEAAFQEAMKANVRKWNYVEACLKRWRVDGFMVQYSASLPPPQPEESPYKSAAQLEAAGFYFYHGSGFDKEPHDE